MTTQKAYAKLNLNLHIIPRKLINGFYEVNFINCELDLCDDLYFEQIPHEIRIVSENKDLPEMHHNLIYKAGVLIKEAVKAKNLGARVILNKQIPIKAGFGGGSTDAAAAIKGFSKLWQIKLDKDKTNQIIGKLGKDVYYSYMGGLCEIKGDGSEVYKLVLNLPNFWLIIITPDQKKPSTEWMYKHLDLNKIGRYAYKFNDLIKNIKSQTNKKRILADLHNDFEISVIHNFPIIKTIKKDLEKNGAKKTLLAGSGLSIVGFYETKEERDKAFAKLKQEYKNILCTKTK